MVNETVTALAQAGLIQATSKPFVFAYKASSR